MSTTMFVEATSADPFVRDVYRRAIRLLNDPTLDRQQRELHIRRLQSILIEHQQKEKKKVERELAKKQAKETVSRTHRNQGVADPSQVAARRREIAGTQAVTGLNPEPVQLAEAVLPAVVPEISNRHAAANDSQLTRRNRQVLRLQRA